VRIVIRQFDHGNQGAIRDIGEANNHVVHHTRICRSHFPLCAQEPLETYVCEYIETLGKRFPLQYQHGRYELCLASWWDVTFRGGKVTIRSRTIMGAKKKCKT
jgi:hypothetical protein